jgi:hypothetical protein
MFIVFALGVVSMLFAGGKTTLQYMQCKIKRKSKIFVWVDTFTGRESVIGTIEGDIKKGVVSWKFNNETHLTEVNLNSVKRWKDIYYMGVNLECPLVAYDITALGEMPKTAIDLKSFQNILNRALTKPSLDDDMTNKILIALGFGLIVILAVLVFMFFKIDTLSTAIATLNVL